MIWFYLIAIALFIIVWLVAGVYITSAATAIGKVKNDDSSASAYSWAVAAACVTWIILGLVIIAAIAFAIFLFFGGDILIGGEAAVLAAEAGVVGGVTKKHRIFHGIELVTVIATGFLLFVTGICAIMAAIDIAKSPSFDPTNNNYNTGYKDSIIASVLAFVALASVIFFSIITSYVHRQRRKKAQEEVRKRIAVKQASAKQNSTASVNGNPQLLPGVAVRP